ncbi:hypothetical protein CDQ92_11660 [Sphingopyxis bauzanensis]|uniref:Uncharacterized protein n=2 Tax=Sphingopyxis bauzanensis TaxID=651663 RepID=A0A246JR80_9SPHN|nr:hypothetical protein [Sphingopyxis bauzanensis]OWQ95478.1 hypothetical protein CDQ92_11660 [Sphingopyxis bauzanensis]GGJ63102.1 hypothetical protein GCM10011393_36590 [Sphingopyxis bauzanensis]
MLTLLFSLALSTATTETPTTKPTTETAAKPDKKPKLVCRRLANTGSRLPERECRTQEDWDRLADTVSQQLKSAK